MPSVIFEVPETVETQLRPIVYNVIDQIALLTTIARDIRVLFPGEAGVGYQIGSTLQKNQPENTFMSQAQLTVKIEDSPVEDRVLSTAVMRRENLAIFNDYLLGVTIRPIYSFNELTMNFTYRAPNRTEAIRFRNDMKMRRSAGRVENLHEIAYSYGIPIPFFPILKELWTLRNNVAGYGDTYEDWFNQYVTPKCTTVTNQAGNQAGLVIREQQIVVLGWFDNLVTVDEPQRDASGTGACEVEFTYRIRYDSAQACVMDFPITIHNQLVPAKYRGNDHIYQPRERARAPAWSRFLFDQYTALYPTRVQGIDGVQFPDFDTWRPGSVYPNTSSIMTTMIKVSLDVPTEVFNLTDTDDYVIDPDVLAFLQGEYMWMTQYGFSVVNLAIYENNRLWGENKLAVDQYLNITTTFPMDPRKTYHLRLSMVTDLLSLPQEAIDRWRQFGPGCLKMLAMMEARLPGGIRLPKLVAGKIVARDDIIKAAKRINSQKVPMVSDLEYIFLATVGNFLIKAGT
jgi:hypothetical protein